MRAPYADYVNHMMRFYWKNPSKEMLHQFRSGVEERNWRACDKVMDGIDVRQKDFLCYIYTNSSNRTIDQNLRTWCKVKQKDVQETWDFLNWVSYRVAKMRGLA
nr:MAG TPA: hypothetical protein [Bacteriophage sp.]